MREAMSCCSCSGLTLSLWGKQNVCASQNEETLGAPELTPFVGLAEKGWRLTPGDGRDFAYFAFLFFPHRKRDWKEVGHTGDDGCSGNELIRRLKPGRLKPKSGTHSSPPHLLNSTQPHPPTPTPRLLAAPHCRNMLMLAAALAKKQPEAERRMASNADRCGTDSSETGPRDPPRRRKAPPPTDMCVVWRG